MIDEYSLLDRYEVDNQGFESFTDYLIQMIDNYVKDIKELRAEVKRLTALFEETNHHLDLMVERFGIEPLVEMVGDES